MEMADGTKLLACGVHFGSECLGGPKYDLFDLIPEGYRIRNGEQVATRIPGLLHEAMTAIPFEWYSDDIYALCARLLQRLQYLQCLRDIATLEANLTVAGPGAH
jgi:hypothetical protein